MLHVESLRPDTRKLYSALHDIPEIGQFTLIGGTALALHHAHRESEDLDFVWTPSDELDPETLDMKITQQILEHLVEHGSTITTAFDQAEFDIAENEGRYLLDSQQNWLIDEVKLTFFVSDTQKRFRDLPKQSDGPIHILTSGALFEIKSRLLVKRATTRDIFDLWYLMHHQGHTFEDMVAYAKDENPYYSDEMIKRQLLPLKQAPNDPGFKSILKGAPDDFDSLIKAMEAIVSEYEERQAEEVVLSSTPRK